MLIELPQNFTHPRNCSAPGGPSMASMTSPYITPSRHSFESSFRLEKTAKEVRSMPRRLTSFLSFKHAEGSDALHYDICDEQRQPLPAGVSQAP